MIETTINISGSTYKLKYPNVACKKIDRALDYSMLHIIEKVNQRGMLAALSMDDITTVLWGGMLHKQPGLQVDQVANIVPIRPIEKYSKVAEKVFNILTEIYGLEEDTEQPEPLEEGNAKADRGNGTGTESRK